MLPSYRHPHSAFSRRFGGTKVHLLFVGLCTLALFALWPSGPSQKTAIKTEPQQQQTTKSTSTGKVSAVPVELFVMSQCPDARFCETAFDDVLKKVPSLITIRTQYIATLANNNTSVTCMHGERECEGNKQQLCLQKHVPGHKNQAWFYPTLLCHGAGDVADSKHMKSCMEKSSIPADVQDKVLKCASSSEGTDLQVKSAQEVKARDVKKSCTVYIGGKRRCIRDGGSWYDCPGGSSLDEFVKTICDAHKQSAGADAPECAATAAGKASN